MRERGSLWSTRPVSCAASMRRFLLSSEGWPYLLVPFIPIAVVFEFAHVGAVPTFFASTHGVIPTAALMGRATEKLALSEFFIGAVVVAIVGNAAEHWVAVLVAAKNKMDLAVNIAIGSSAQIALFVAPVLVLCSFFLGPHPMALVFNGFELAAVPLPGGVPHPV